MCAFYAKHLQFDQKIKDFKIPKTPCNPHAIKLFGPIELNLFLCIIEYSQLFEKSRHFFRKYKNDAIISDTTQLPACEGI